MIKIKEAKKKYLKRWRKFVEKRINKAIRKREYSTHLSLDTPVSIIREVNNTPGLVVDQVTSIFVSSGHCYRISGWAVEESDDSKSE